MATGAHGKCHRQRDASRDHVDRESGGDKLVVGPQEDSIAGADDDAGVSPSGGSPFDLVETNFDRPMATTPSSSRVT